VVKVRERVLAADLSDQEGVYYVGCLPGCDTRRLLSYSHKTEPKKEAPLYWFSDCAMDDDDVSLLPYTASEVTEFLQRV
jgi:hypothetical protein